MSNEEPAFGTPDNQPTSTPSSEGSLIRTLILPKEDYSLGSLLEESLKAQVVAGDTSATLKLIELFAEQRSQMLALQQAELNLRDKELSNKHELALRGEERQTKADVATKNNIRLIIATFTIAFLASLGYATFSKDSNLADKVFTGALGLLGGGGGVALLSKKSNEKEQDKAP